MGWEWEGGNGKPPTPRRKFDEDEESVGLIQPPTRPWEWEGGNGKPPTPRRKFDEDEESVGLIQPPTRPWEWAPRPTKGCYFWRRKEKIPYNPTPRLRKRPRQVFGRL